jgi:LysR family transcriptional regulator, repressor for citA
MDIKLLRTFTVMAKELNFHRTAERLYLTQPTVSVHIRQLEEYVGEPLFERAGRKVRLTAAGERFLIHANRILEAHDEAVSDMTRWKMGYDDRLDVLISPLCAEIILPSIWRQFTSLYPNVEVRIYTTLSHSVGPGIAAGRSHLGISLVPSKHPDTVTCKLYNDPVVFIAPGGIHAEQEDYRRLLMEHPLLTKNHPAYWDDILYQLHDRQIPFRPMTVSQVHITRKLIVNGLGVSFLPLSAVKEEILLGKLINVRTPDLHLPMAAAYVITPRNKDLPRAAGNFLRLLKESLIG